MKRYNKALLVCCVVTLLLICVALPSWLHAKSVAIREAEKYFGNAEYTHSGISFRSYAHSFSPMPKWVFWYRQGERMHGLDVSLFGEVHSVHGHGPVTENTKEANKASQFTSQ